MSKFDSFLRLHGMLCVFMPLLSCGCASQEPQVPHYDNSFWNVTPNMVNEVGLDWDTSVRHFHQGAGQVPPAVYHYVGSTMVEAPYPIPEKVVVSWKTKDGEPHQQTVQVASRIPDIEHFKGSIFYQFTDHGVFVVPRSYAYQEENVRQGKAAVP